MKRAIFQNDAFEDREDGEFLEAPSGNMQACVVSPPDKPDSSDDDCHSEEEFRARAFKLYGIAPQ